MNQDQYKKWIAELPSLTGAQLAELTARLKLLSQISVKEHDGKQDFGNRVLQAVCEVLRKIGVETPSVNMLKKSSAYGSSREKIQDLVPFFENISKSKLAQDAILKKGVELLYYDLVDWQGIAISSHTLLRQVHRIPAVINRHFPGYAQSGLLTKLIKAT